jgi:outer membrane protein assembly factor BamB
MQGGKMLRLSGVLVGLFAVFEFSLDALASSSLEPLTEQWSYNYYHHSPDSLSEHDFPGVADPDGNLYWLICDMTLSHGQPRYNRCTLRSTDFDGNVRYEVPIGSGLFGEYFSFRLHLVAGRVVVVEHSGLLIGIDTATGATNWTHDLRGDTRYTELAYDGEGRIIVAAGSWVQALSAEDGTTIWRRFLGSEGPKRRATARRVILDESRNLYLLKDLYRSSYPSGDYDSSIVSLGPDASLRFEIPVDHYVLPIAVAYGRILVGQQVDKHWVELLDAQTGARIARLPGTLADAPTWVIPSGLMTRELGFFIQRTSTDDIALAAFDLVSGTIRWRFPLDNTYEERRTALLSEEGNILIANNRSLLEISPQGQLLHGYLLRSVSGVTPRVSGGSLLLRGRWFSKFFEQGELLQGYDTVFAYDLPGAPGEGRLGWNSQQGNAQGENRPREE